MKEYQFRESVLALLMVMFLVCGATNASAEIPKLINYQGMLTDTTGSPLNDTLSIKYAIYASAVGGSPLWQETRQVLCIDGIYNVLLGSAVEIPDNLFDDPNRYLGIAVGTEAEMTPRQQFTSVPYAFNAGRASSGTPGVGTEIHVDRYYSVLALQGASGNKNWAPINLSSYVPPEATAVYLLIRIAGYRPITAGDHDALSLHVRDENLSAISERRVYGSSDGLGTAINDTAYVWLPLGPGRLLQWSVQEIWDSKTSYDVEIVVNGYLK